MLYPYSNKVQPTSRIFPTSSCTYKKANENSTDENKKNGQSKATNEKQKNGQKIETKSNFRSIYESFL